jgi:hypothetical protein
MKQKKKTVASLANKQWRHPKPKVGNSNTFLRSVVNSSTRKRVNFRELTSLSRDWRGGAEGLLSKQDADIGNDLEGLPQLEEQYSNVTRHSKIELLEAGVEVRLRITTKRNAKYHHLVYLKLIVQKAQRTRDRRPQ